MQDIFKSEYTGLVLEKIQYRGLTIRYKNLKTKKDRDINSTENLFYNSNVGDTIIKIANSNLCIIKNKNKNIKLKCYELDFEQ